ncbi:hypothetical protein GWN42_19410 [candidate division KSB1 bacterium]|nr:hypothetical protein [candidate division KSB1 bacterium]
MSLNRARKDVEMERLRREECQRIRQRARAIFHDELGRESTRLTLYTEIASRRVTGASPHISEYVNKINEASRNLSRGMRDFLWLLEPKNDCVYELAIYLKDLGDELFHKSGIAFRVKGLFKKLKKAKISLEHRLHLVSLFREAADNILKRSGCKNAILKISLDETTLEISLSDDCPDFDREDLKIRKGMEAMQVRARQLRGELHVVSRNGQGATVQFTCDILKNLLRRV